jgi:hypothetical protein
MPHLTANSIALRDDPAFLGPLTSATDLLGDGPGLREAMAQRGYLFFPGLIDPAVVLEARREVLTKYAILGEIDDRHPIMDAIAGEAHGVANANLRAFSESVRSGFWYRQVTDNNRLIAMYADLLGGPVKPYDFRWPRFVRPGEGCGFHCDGPYMNRGTDRLFSSWIPLGSVAREEGALIILEDSHRSDELQNGYLRADADRDGLVWLENDPVALQQRYGKRWLTTDFQPGDVLCFTMHTLHGALDNQSPIGRCRLSSDSRYQRADEPTDPRWNGPVIEGHGGSRVFYPGLGRWANADFQDEWKYVDTQGRLAAPSPVHK